MAIESKHLVIYKSEKLSDTDDGGGAYSGVVVPDGVSNNLFLDISELDRTTGRVSMRKVFPAVTSDDTDTLMGATLFIAENPADPAVSALLFSTKNWTDVREQAQNRVENYLAKGGQATGCLLDTHWQGMKQLQVMMFVEESPNNVGDTIVLVSNEGKSNQVEQYVRITAVESKTAYFMVNGNKVAYQLVKYDISDALVADFVGLSQVAWYNGNKPETLIRDSLVADTGSYYSSVGLVEPAKVGSVSIMAKSIFSQLVPSAQVENNLTDVSGIPASVVLIAGAKTALTQSYVMKGQNLYLGSGVYPSSLTLLAGGLSYRDEGGKIMSDNQDVGVIDYENGLISWNKAMSGSAVVSFIPAVATNRTYNSASVAVTAETQSLNWNGYLRPLPSAGSVTVSFLAQGNWYVLKDDGNGKLAANESGVGVGSVNYQSGAWSLTCGALPDVGSAVILTYGANIATYERASWGASPAFAEIELPADVLRKTVVLTWSEGGVDKKAVMDSSGRLSGDADGVLENGVLLFYPKNLPSGAVKVAYSVGELTKSTLDVSPDGGQQLTFRLGSGGLAVGSVKLSIPVTDKEKTAVGVVVLYDKFVSGSTGDLVDSFGVKYGTVDYGSGNVVVVPVLKTVAYRNYTYTESESESAGVVGLGVPIVNRVVGGR